MTLACAVGPAAADTPAAPVQQSDTRTVPQAPAMEATWYGMLNKEVRWVLQRHAAGARSLASATEVDGNEGRLGARARSGPFRARLEVGLNPSLDRPREDGSFALIRIRHASVTWQDERLGTVLIGRDYLPATLEALQSDPLLPSGLGALGVDAVRQVAGYRGPVGMGYVVHAPVAQLTYRTPPLAGFELAVSYARDNTGLLTADERATQSYTGRWQGQAAGMAVRTGVSYDRAADCAGDFWCVGRSGSHAQWFLAGSWRALQASAMVSRERARSRTLWRSFAAVSHGIGRGRAVASLARVDHGAGRGADLQIAAGYVRALIEQHVEGRLMLGVVDIDGDDEVVVPYPGGAGHTRNRGVIALGGVTLWF
jgi:hypothetical protein